MLIAVINESTTVSNAEVMLMCKAIQTQLTLHLLPAWNMKSGKVKFYEDRSKIPGHAWLVTILDSSKTASVLGYHSEDDDKVDGFVFAKSILEDGGKTLYDAENPHNLTISAVLSHEICEMVGDRFAGFWSEGPSRHEGNEYALEICDPVSSDFYQIMVDQDTGPVSVSVSNFIFPSWFNPQAKVPDNLPFDYLKKLDKPFSMTDGGYMIMSGRHGVKLVFDAKAPEWKRKRKLDRFSRNQRLRK